MKLGFVGSGAMAEAIIKGLIGKGIYKGENIWVTNKKNDEKLIYMRENYGVNTTKNLEEFFKNIDIVIIAVKPKDVLGFLNSAKEYIKPHHIIISVAAGITTELIENTIGEDIRVIRAMPNISCEVGESATAIAKGRFSDDEALTL
ncbi:MAG: pyrroline-5-carboxylate reductase family protein [Thermovenabulum sp.]|uniref:pyrroline-5-carboxylate reductase family protein n=1 Tax=Thermovenabulum sp. TaxID=3100335 RepID=UPI003C7DB12B